MSGHKFLLDTNSIIGLLKNEPHVLKLVDQKKIKTSQCAYSIITGLELISFQGISLHEEKIIKSKLSLFEKINIVESIEDLVITIRRAHKWKLPDAII